METQYTLTLKTNKMNEGFSGKALRREKGEIDNMSVDIADKTTDEQVAVRFMLILLSLSWFASIVCLWKWIFG